MFIILLQTALDRLNSLICTSHFSNSFDSVFNEQIEKIFCVLAVKHIYKKEQIGYLKYSLLTTKIHYISR